MEPAVARVSVATGSRLHFGLLTHRPVSGREFGGIGVMIDEPGWSLRFTRSDADQIELAGSCGERESSTARTDDDQKTIDRVRKTLLRCRERMAISNPVTVEIRGAIAPHCGLGSGTQLGLAVARGLDVLFAGGARRADELAVAADRGLRSAVGIHGFEHGGLIVDGGHAPGETLGTVLLRLNVPQDWRFLLIIPEAVTGLSGSDEISAFQALTGMEASRSAELCRIVLMDLLPALKNADFTSFSESLWGYGRLVGEYFSAVQGGVFADVRMLRIAEELRRSGVTGFAQTSWGPTCAVLCCSEDEATRIEKQVHSLESTSRIQTRIVSARNRGADVSVTS